MDDLLNLVRRDVVGGDVIFGLVRPPDLPHKPECYRLQCIALYACCLTVPVVTHARALLGRHGGSWLWCSNACSSRDTVDRRCSPRNGETPSRLEQRTPRATCTSLPSANQGRPTHHPTAPLP